MQRLAPASIARHWQGVHRIGRKGTAKASTARQSIGRQWNGRNGAVGSAPQSNAPAGIGMYRKASAGSEGGGLHSMAAQRLARHRMEMERQDWRAAERKVPHRNGAASSGAQRSGWTAP